MASPSNRLRDLRAEAGITQAQLAAASGINLRQLQKIEAGEIKLGNVTLTNAVALARALGIAAEDLI
jgi:transcriptional regulator with XRE-family HTH domain